MCHVAQTFRLFQGIFDSCEISEHALGGVELTFFRRLTASGLPGDNHRARKSTQELRDAFLSQTFPGRRADTRPSGAEWEHLLITLLLTYF